MLLLGCTPAGRKTEQHDIFFGISETLKGLVPDIIASWECAGKIHIDVWREVNTADGCSIKIADRQVQNAEEEKQTLKLFFINLGGYKQNEFDEYHYKMLAVAENKSKAIEKAKATAFYKHMGFTGAQSHIDDKYGIDVDEVYEIADILPQHLKEKYSLQITEATDAAEDAVHPGYLLLDT